MKLTGQQAIEYAERTGAELHKYADPTEGARDGITAAEAYEIAAEDPTLVWVDASEHTDTTSDYPMWALYDSNGIWYTGHTAEAAIEGFRYDLQATPDVIDAMSTARMTPRLARKVAEEGYDANHPTYSFTDAGSELDLDCDDD